MADLKKELKDRGLTTTGTKDVLLERLEAVLGGTGYFILNIIMIMIIERSAPASTSSSTLLVQ